MGKSKALILADRWGRVLKNLEEFVMALKYIIGNGKTFTSGLLSIGYGAAGYYFGLHDAATAVGFVSAGVATLGIGHKLELVKSALQGMPNIMPVILALVMASMFTVACTPKPYQLPEACGDGSDSLIVKTFPDLNTTSLVLRIAAYEGVKHSKVTKAQAIAAIDDIEKYMDATPGVMFCELIAKTKTELDGVELLLLSEIVPGLDVKMPISQCDKALIKAHFAKQRATLSLLPE